MRPDPRFVGRPKDFWAHVRTISQLIGYTERATKQIRVPSMTEIQVKMERAGLRTQHLVNLAGQPTSLGDTIRDYFDFRARVLNDIVEPLLMDAREAQALFDALKQRLCPRCPVPMNKQKGTKKAPAYLTGIVNMLIEEQIGDLSCAYDPRELTTVTRDGMPLRTLARRVDGAFPSTLNPIAIWEIKEYYYTTTFGSRVADGVYETLLDGMELEELREHESIDVKHYLMIDSHYTWWDCGRSYLCRVIDMLHMGYVDEVLFGKEVVTRLPAIVREWVAKAGPSGPCDV